jgi:AcrR family transcriptional regulator
LFGVRGYSDVSMQDVARASGVTKAALYYHFTDKQDLYTTVALERIDAIRVAMEGAANEGTLEDRLIRLALVGFERMQTDVYGPHLNAHQHLDEDHHQQLHVAMDRLREPVIRCFAEAGTPDPTLNPDVAAALLSGTLFALIFAFDESDSEAPVLPTDRTERATLAIRLFLRGYWEISTE